jgi:hypothetical protein
MLTPVTVGILANVENKLRGLPSAAATVHKAA